MTIQWILFVPGALLLLIPADCLLSARVELRSFDCFRRLGQGRPHRPWWWIAILWLDPLRAYGGTYLLRQALALTSFDGEGAGKAGYAALVVIGSAAVVAQTFTRRGDHGVMLAPMGFVGGMVAALAPWPVALLGVATAFVGLFAFRQFHAFFAFGLVAVALLGFVLESSILWIVPAVGTFGLPVIVGLVSGRTLELPVRDSSGPRPASLARASTRRGRSV